MNAKCHDTLARALTANVGPRRAALRLFAALPLAGGLATLLGDASDAARRRKLRQRRDERHNQVHDARKKRKKKKKKSAPPSSPLSPPPPSCVARSCPANTCGNLSDGCGGTLTCSCPANQICLSNGLCQACDVTCASGNPESCGDDLQVAMDAGGTVHVCPGNYRGEFTISRAVTLIGAGEGDGPGTNTILDANLAGRVLHINAAVGSVELQRLRLIRGNAGSDGAGIAHLGTLLRMTECTVSDNTTVNSSGGGIFVSNDSELQMTRCTLRGNKTSGTGTVNGGAMYTQGTTTLTDCLVEDNDANAGGGLYHHDAITTLDGTTRFHDNHANLGGGFYVQGGTLTIAKTCRVTENRAANSILGGGIYTERGTVTLQGTDDPSPIVVNNCHENCAGQAVARCSTVAPVSCPP